MAVVTRPHKQQPERTRGTTLLFVPGAAPHYGTNAAPPTARLAVRFGLKVE